MSHGLLHEPGKGREVKPGLAGAIAHKFLPPTLGQWKTQGVPADPLGLQFKTRGAGKVAGRKPQMAGFGLGRIDFNGNIVVDNSGSDLLHGASSIAEKLYKEAISNWQIANSNWQ
jgi:hypothetical protein